MLNNDLLLVHFCGSINKVTFGEYLENNWNDSTIKSVKKSAMRQKYRCM